MARAFSAAEKAAIRRQLMETARELFPRYGLAKTRLEELTGPAGIAKSSFYKFYDSKEALYLALLLEEMPASLERIMDASFRATDDLAEALALYVRAALQEREDIPLMKRLVSHPGDLTLLARRMPPDELAKVKLDALTLIQPRLETALARGELAVDDVEVVFGLLRALTALPLIQDVIGPPELFQQVQECLIEFVTHGIVNSG